VARDATEASFVLDGAGRHVWWPIAPRGELDVRLRDPDVTFRARGYFDANAGEEPLEATFRGWAWSRAHAARGRTLLTYDVRTKDGALRTRAFALRDGAIEPLGGSSARPLGRTRWGLAREAHAEGAQPPRLLATLEDGPFYARSVVETRLGGETVRAVHETLAADRLSWRAVSFLSGFRMRRARGC
jgi:carotenoid 1,2-hydratase